MDITTISGATAYQQQKLAANVQASVDAKVLNIAKTQGGSALVLLQAATLMETQSAGNGGASSNVDAYA